MVFGVVAEREGVADFGFDDGRLEYESAAADGYGNVGGKTQRKHGEERDRERGMHLVFLSTNSGEDLD